MKFLKRLLLVLLLVVLAIFLYLKSNIGEVVKGKTTYAQVERLQIDIDSIVNQNVPRNYRNLGELNRVASYIKSEFEKVSDSTAEQIFVVENVEYKNIICSINAEKEKRIIIGAHYDVCGDQDGADDNASGVVGLLELARLLKDKELNYRIDFVAYTLEEPPFYGTENMGSYVHAKYLSDNKIPVKGMISLEMIGYFSDEAHSQSYPLPFLKYVFGDKGNFITLVNKLNSGDFASDLSNTIISNPSIRTIMFRGPKALPGIDFSDHRNYWMFDYSAFMITNTAFYRNKNYHLESDRVELLDFEKMGLVINQLYDALIDF